MEQRPALLDKGNYLNVQTADEGEERVRATYGANLLQVSPSAPKDMPVAACLSRHPDIRVSTGGPVSSCR